MTDTWIKMRKKLLTDPRVWAVSRKLEISVHAVLGGLFHLWCIADDHGGNLSALDADTLDEMVRIKGLVSALPACWIQVQSTGIVLPEYDEHNGSTGKRRSMETKRRADARNVSALDADKKRTREDKSREDTTTTLSDKSDARPAYSEAFDAFWAFYPRKIGKGKAWSAFKRLKADDRLAAIDQAEAYAQAYEMAPDSRRQFFKHPATWLNARSWEDDHAEWSLLIEGR